MQSLKNRQVVCIDAGVEDRQALLAGLPDDVEVLLLRGREGGLRQVAAALEGRSGIDALHLICHGAPGKLFVGNSTVDREILMHSHAEVEAIRNAMAEDGALLIYGCEVAQGLEGRRFVEKLRSITGLKVAAATHKVGAAELGGDWELNVGMPATQTLRVAGWGHVLADPVITLYNGTVATGTNFFRPYTPFDNGGTDSVRVYSAADILTQTSPDLQTSSAPYNYTAVAFQPSVTETYDIKVAAANFTPFTYDGSDTFLAVYENTFDPTAPLTNLLWVNDDTVDQEDYKSSIPAVTLDASKIYIFVMTTYDAGSAGTYSFAVTGPASGTFTSVLPKVDLNGATNGIDGAVTYTLGGAAVALTSGTTNLADADSTELKSLTVSIDSATVKTGDALVIGAASIVIDSTTPPGTITVGDIDFDYELADTSGTLAITFTSTSGGSATPAAIAKFEGLIDALKLQTSDTTSATRVFSVSVKDANNNDAETRAQLTVTIEAAAAPITSTADTLTINEDTVTALTASDFGTLTGTLHTVKITTLPTAGSLQYKTGETTWGSVSTNQTFTKAQIDNGELRFTPYENKNDNSYATIGFQVSGDGSAFSSAYDLTVNVTPVQDAPAINALALHAIFQATNGTSGWEPFITDGTSTGTSLVKDIQAGAGNGLFDNANYKQPYFTSLGNKVVFAGLNTTSGQRGLYVTDGTADGTTVLTAATGQRIDHPTEMTRLGDKILFQASVSTLGGRELWVTDGTSAGTLRLKDINPGAGNAFDISSSSPANPFAVVGNKAYFTANDGTNGAELWVTDGTEAGTQMVKDVYTGATGSSILYMKAVGDKVYFAAKSSTSGAAWEPWVSDGTADGTIQLKAGVPSTFQVSDNSSYAPQFVAVGNKVLFMAFQAGSGYELWEINGTPGGTALLKDIISGTTHSVPEIYSLGTKALIFANSSTGGKELWVTDGTADNTTLLVPKTTVQPWTSGVVGTFGIVVGGKLYFQGEDSDSGNNRELWVTDGTVGGTQLVKEIQVGDQGGIPSNFAEFGEGVLFYAYDPNTFGTEPWYSDGTTAGTALVKDINAGTANADPRYFSTFLKAVAEARGNKLGAIAEDVAAGSNAGSMVSSLVQSYLITDPDLTTAPKAIAVSAVDSTNGTWQYKAGGGSWAAFDFSANSGKALLLDATDSVRFLPNENYNGTVTNGVTFHAWDKTAGNAGDYLTVSGNTGGDKTLSTVTATSGVTVTPTNDASTGVPTITGTLAVSKTLTASTTAVADVDGLGSFSYQWQVSETGQDSWSDIDFAASSTYEIGAGYGGKDIRVKVSFTDQGGTAETVYSALSTIGTPPTLTAFAAAVDSGNEDQQIELTYAELLAQGDESGTTTQFVVKAVSSGTLKIGADAASATAWNANTNATIDATHKAYWTPAENANGNGVGAFTVVAADADGGESATPVAVTVNLAAVNDLPTITETSAPAGTQGAAYSHILVANDPDGDALTWAVQDGESLPGWLSIGKATSTTATPIALPGSGLGSFTEYAEIAESTSHVFISNSQFNEIIKIAKADNSVSSIAAPSFPYGLAYADGFLYYSQVSGVNGIYKLAENGGTPQLIKSGDIASKIAYSNGYLYYQKEGTAGITKLKADGTEAVSTIQATPTGSGETQHAEVFAAGQYLYIGVNLAGDSRNNIVRYDTQTDDKTQLFSSNLTQPVRDIAVDSSGDVYFALPVGYPNTIYKTSGDGNYVSTDFQSYGGFLFDSGKNLWAARVNNQIDKYAAVDALIGTPGANDVGVHTVKIKVSDGQGGVALRTLDVNVAPGATGAPDLATASDLGSSDTDNITNSTTPTFTGTAVAGATVKLYDTNGTTELGAATAGNDGNWSITSSTLSAGAHTMQAKQIVDGAVSAISSGLSVTIDTTAPAKTVSGIVLSADSGASSGDFNTATAAQTITATLSATLSGDELWGSLDNGENWSNITGKVSGTTLTWDGVTLPGSNTLKLQVRDTAGNAGTTASQAYTLDTTVPTATITGAGYTITSNTLKLTGTNFNTLLAASETAATDIKARLDWTKLSWDIDGDDGTTANVSFALSDISSAKVASGTTMIVVLTDAKGTALEAASGFGASGAADTLDVSAGFSRDLAGNTATTDAASNAALGIATSSVSLSVDNPFTPNDTTDTTTVTITVPDGINISSASNSPVGVLPKNVKMPLGQFGFTLEGVESGGTVQMSMAANADFKQFSYFKKSLVTNKWVNIMEGVTINNDGTATVQFSLKDGGEFDADRTANGVIVDPGGVGQNALLPMIAENTTEVGNISLQNEAAATGTLSYAITGGADTAKFSINASTGLLSFQSAPNYENPTDAGDTANNNTYAVQVTVTGSTSGSEVQNLIVSVLNVAEEGDNPNTAPVIIGLRAEAQAVTAGSAAALDDIRMADVDGNSMTLTLTATNGTIGGLTDADPATPGIQLAGTAVQINTALANATFTAAAAGAAGVSLSIVDTSVSSGTPATTTAYYSMTAAAAPPPPVEPPPVTPPVVPPETTPTVPPLVELVPVQATITTQTVSVTRTQIDPLTGQQTQVQVQTEQLTVAAVSQGLGSDTKAEVASVPLFWGESSRTEWATTALMPVGIQMQAEGSRAPVSERTAAQALNELVSMIDQTAPSTDGGKSALLGGGQQFLQGLGSQLETLVVNKITLSAAPQADGAPAAASSTPIVIQGTATAVQVAPGQSHAPVEALVIDTRSLPAGSIIDLKNIEFAVIVGDNVTVRGGAGMNIFYAGAGSQNIKLGADDDVLYAGDGNDWVGSAGGNDRIFGENGNDVLYGGIGNDHLDGGTGIDIALFGHAFSEYTLQRQQNGSWIISHAEEGADILLNIEFAEFADQTISLAGADAVNQWAHTTLVLF